MAAQIPIKDDPEASRAALDKVRADKLREVKDGLVRSLGPRRFDAGRFREAANLFDRMSTSEVFEEFLTLPAYESLP